MATLAVLEKAVDSALLKRGELEKAIRQTRNLEIFAGFVAYAVPKFVYDFIQAAKNVAQDPEAAGKDSDGNTEQGKNTDPS